MSWRLSKKLAEKEKELSDLRRDFRLLAAELVERGEDDCAECIEAILDGKVGSKCRT